MRSPLCGLGFCVLVATAAATPGARRSPSVAFTVAQPFGQDAIRRIFFNVNGAARTLLELINDRRMEHVVPEDKTR